MNSIDRFLNRITMYRLVVYVLGILSAIGIIFSLTGRLASTPAELIGSLALLIVSVYVTDRLFGRLFTIPVNMESALITALILFLVLKPADSLAGIIALVLAGTVASASKFILAWNGKHIFNPAAFAAALLSLTGIHTSTWWIGSSLLWPCTLLLGLAVVRKVRRFSLFAIFIVVAVTMQLLMFSTQGHLTTDAVQAALISSPLIFLATIMLTEPATMPPRRNLQLLFGALVALLYVGAWKIGPVVIYPTVALLVGNLFAYIVSPKFRLQLQLVEIQRISDRVFTYVFKPHQAFSFRPGQYMEWTLPGVAYDSRGNRRTFTIASSPTEPTVQLAVKYYEPASTFKAALSQLKPGDIVYASQLAGNFTLNGNEKKKLVFIAGGIGITPFRSMIKYLTDRVEAVDIVLLCAVSDIAELAYKRELMEGSNVGVKVIPIVTTPNQPSPDVINAQLDSTLITQLVPDYKDRLFYVSGPHAMVETVEHDLHKLCVAKRHIKTDHFSGY